MKGNLSFPHCVLTWSVPVLVFVLCATANGQSTAFTYQGRLNDGTNGATGLYDLQFVVHSAASGATPVGSPLTQGAVQVNDGFFTVSLDFGAGVFTGANRWLEISVRTNGTASYQTLSPRQPISSSPYAIRAAEAGSAATAGSATVASTVSLNAVSTAGLQNNSVTSDKIQDGTIAAADLDATLLNGTFWRLDGNALDGSQFLGSVNNQPVNIHVNGRRGLRLEAAGSSVNVIGGWSNNVATPGVAQATIAGGGGQSAVSSALYTNRVLDSYGTIGGGLGNTVGNDNPDFADARGATVAGGGENTAAGLFSIIGGGSRNTALGSQSLIGGGFENTVATEAHYASIAGGQRNQISSNGWYGFIGGGWLNLVGTNSYGSVIAGGYSNQTETNTFYSAVGGGALNIISNRSMYAVVSGGSDNRILPDASFSVIGGGKVNRAGAEESTIAGGAFNNALAFSSTIGGGGGNRAEGAWTVVSGGRDNQIQTNSIYSAVGGGDRNVVQSNVTAAAIGGGQLNIIATNANYATIPGGAQNLASAPFSFAAGFRAQAGHQGSFVWADSALPLFPSTTSNQFNVRAGGGVRIQSNPGIQLNAADTPLITRGFDAFSTNAPSHKQGHGRWGLFMEPFRLNIGIPSNDIPNRFFSVAKYDTNGNYTPLMTVDQEGVVTASEFIGVGTGLTGVNASQLGGMNPSSFAPASHNHFGESWTGSLVGQGGLTVRNSGSGAGSAGIIGRHGSGSGITIGTPAGAWGDAQTGFGLLGISSDTSTSGRGVYGVSWTGDTGFGTGVYGFATGGNAVGTRGAASSQSGAGVGLYGETASTNGGSAVFATAYGASGTTYAVRGSVSSSSGYGAYFIGPAGSRNYFQRNVGIGTTSPSFLLHLSTDSAAKPTSSSWTISSDERLKKNIRTLEGSLDRLLQLRGVSYQWVDPTSQGDMDGTYTGLIAQEVEPVFPEWIRTGEDGYKTLTVIGFEALAVEALRGLRAEKDAEIAELKQRVDDLTKLVTALLEKDRVAGGE